MGFFSLKSMKAAYLGLITFLLGCIGIKYGISNTNPFHDSTLSLLVTAVISHLIATAADMDHPNTIITFYLSGIVACETLLWILIAQLFWFSLVNFLVLIIFKFLFSHFLTQLLLPYFNRITQLLPGTPPNASDMPNSEQQRQDSQLLSVLGDCKEWHDIYSFSNDTEDCCHFSQLSLLKSTKRNPLPEIYLSHFSRGRT